VFSDSEDDPDFTMSNQEKLWSTIETKQSINIIKELISRKDVDVNMKN
jgi:hypothetical protein